ncbi:MAG: PIG-L family deacetylase [Vulcanimicrobiaceae bacterium]
MEASTTRATLAIFAHDRIAAIAPHPDDDVLGCGGVLAAATDRGAAIMVAYLTDGEASHPPTATVPAHELGRVRAREALAALEALGAPPAVTVHFLKLPDGALDALGAARFAAATAELRSYLEAFAPTLVFVPWRRDPHPDHRAGATIAAGAIARARLPHVARVLEYRVWLEQRGTDADIARPGEATEVHFFFDERLASRKRRAIAAHRSQTTGLRGAAPGGFTLPLEMIARACAGREIYYEAARGA